MANIVSKNKDGYGYKYTDLSEIHRYLESINSRYIQKIERIEGDDYIFTKRCFDDKWEDEWLQGSRVIQATLSGIKNPAQENGSALTYARRYSVLMAYGLCTDDDDAQSLSRPIITSKEEALEYKLTFGKYNGKTLKEISETNDSYMYWLVENGDETIKKACELLGYSQKTEEDVKNMPIQESQKNRIKDEVDTETIKMYLKTVGKSKLSELTYFEAEELLK